MIAFVKAGDSDMDDGVVTGDAAQGVRLKAERDRLNLSQEQMGEAGGVKRLSQANYENGVRFPDSLYLAGIAKIGADVQYIVTGSRSDKVTVPEHIKRLETAAANIKITIDLMQEGSD